MRNLKFKLFILGIMLLASPKIKSYYFDVDGIKYNIVSLDDSTVEIVFCERDDRIDITIPNTVTYGDRPFKVISIGESAFSGNALNTLQIGENIRSIKDGAFSRCKNLQSVILNESLESINDAFWGCTNLKEITFKSKSCTISEDIFYNCTNLVKVNIPSLNEWCNYNFEGLIFRYCPNVGLYIDDNLVEKVCIPTEITELKPYSFAYLKTIKEIVLTNNITKIGREALRLTSVNDIIIPNSCDTICRGAFSGLNLEKLVIPGNVKYIEPLGTLSNEYLNIGKLIIEDGPDVLTLTNEYSYLYHVNIKEFYWNRPINGLLYQYVRKVNGTEYKETRYDSSIFYEYKSLNKVVIGEKIEKLDSKVFYNCPSLEKLEISDSDLPIIFNQNNGFRESSTGIPTRYTPVYYNEFKKSPLREIYLGRSIFFERDSLSQYDEGGRVSDPGRESPFNAKYTVEKVVIGDNVTELPNIALFFGCPLKYISIGKGLSDIPRNCLSSTPQTLKNIILSNSNPPTYNGFENWVYLNTRLNVPETAIETFKWAEPWGNFWNIGTLEEIEVLPDEIILNPEKLQILVGETIKIDLKILPEYSTCETTDITWGSSDDSIATISTDGFITGVSTGKVIISAQYGEILGYCEFEILPILAESISLLESEISISEKETFKLKATISPDNVTDKTIIWKSSDENIAIVSNEGLVTGVSVGKTSITASCGDVSAICKVTVLAEDGVDKILMDADSVISIYSLEGVLIKKECSAEELNQLTKGIYVIVSGNNRFKISL